MLVKKFLVKNLVLVKFFTNFVNIRIPLRDRRRKGREGGILQYLSCFRNYLLRIFPAVAGNLGFHSTKNAIIGL